MNARGYSARDEQRLLAALGRGLVREFPNPGRSGCPGPDVLKRIASRTMPLDQAEKWLDHLGSCSPCYSDFSEFRKSHELRKKRTLLAIAASILVVAGITGWVLLQRHNETLVAQTAVLDLRNRSLPRGTEANPVEPPLVVSRAAAHWNIFLPFGSNDGVRHSSIGGLGRITRVDKSRREIDRRRCCDSDIGRFVLPFPWAVCFATDKKWGSREFLCS